MNMDISNSLFQWAGAAYKIITKHGGIYPEIMTRMMEQLDAILSIYGRVLVVRVDLHSYGFDETNNDVSAFMDRALKRIKRKYKLAHIAYCWAREKASNKKWHPKTKKQHYHIVFFISGRAVQTSYKITEMIEDMWNSHPDRHACKVPYPYHFINDEQSYANAVHRFSYLAKIAGKGKVLHKIKNFSTSRLKAVKHKPFEESLAVTPKPKEESSTIIPFKSYKAKSEYIKHQTIIKDQIIETEKLSNLQQVAMAIAWKALRCLKSQIRRLQMLHKMRCLNE